MPRANRTRSASTGGLGALLCSVVPSRRVPDLSNGIVKACCVRPTPSAKHGIFTASELPTDRRKRVFVRALKQQGSPTIQTFIGH